MRSRRFTLLLSILALAGCSSSKDAREVGLIEPEIRVRQIAGQLLPRVGVDTDISLEIDVFNQSSEQIVLERIELRSTPTSEIVYRSAVRQLKEQIPPGEVRTVEMWVVAQQTNPRADERSPVWVRGTAIFSSPFGRFRSVFIEPVIVHELKTPGVD